MTVVPDGIDEDGVPAAVTRPVYAFEAPGVPVELHEGEFTVAARSGVGRIWMQTSGEVDYRWQMHADWYRSMRESRLAFSHSALGPVDCPARVTLTVGRGVVTSTQLGPRSIGR